MIWTADEHRPACDRVGYVRAQALAKQGELEAASVKLAEDLDARKRAQQPIERSWMGLRLCGKLIACATSTREQVCDAKHSYDVDGLGDLIPLDQPSNCG